jgi:pimeloyl-ACP methyl ester carboxylesterase
MATSEASAPTPVPHSFISLTTKPNASLAYSFIPAKGTPPPDLPLIVFLNGLGLPASSWYPTIALLTQRPSHPAILAYDRYGQGFTVDHDPLDAGAEDSAFAHDCMTVVRDLHQLLQQIISLHHLALVAGIFFVGNSLGCAVARLYAQTYPNSVSALLLLDSVMANSDMVSMYPDPDGLDFERKYLPLPNGVTVEGLKEAREKMDRMFSPLHGVMGKVEGLTRRNLAELLPYSDRPLLTGVDGRGPWLCVVGHGFERFAEESLKVRVIYARGTRSYNGRS